MSKDDYIDAIIKIKVPKWQIGEECSIHFKDTMCVKGVCEAVNSSKEHACCYWDKGLSTCMCGKDYCPDDYSCEFFD